MRKVIAAVSLIFLSATTHLPAQSLFPPPAYPHDYFRNPLAVPISLAANFGELRPNHYHMGLDIRTQHRENLPVYAAADGYVARVQIEPAGFGQAIYIHHPNGYTTVYGHLNQFFPGLAAYVREQQYKRESWQVDLEIPPSLFPVKRGDFIAYSGNTGGSQGPHLHFEIRRTAGDVNQNPLLFGLPVPDNTAPAFVRLAWYDRNQGIYEQSPHILPVHKTTAAALSKITDASATTPWTITPVLLNVSSNRISLAISAFDTQSGSANPNGIYEATLYKDELPVIAFRMNDISYENTRNLNAHIDYRTRALGGPYLQQLSLLQGYPAPTIYASPAGAPTSGVLDLSDGRIHAIRIEIKDTYGNSSTLFFQLKYQAPAAAPVPAIPEANARRFYPGMVDGIETEDCAFYLGERSLYDSVTIATTVAGYPGAGVSLPGAVSAAHVIGGSYIPLLQPVLVRLLPKSPSAGLDSMHRHSWSAASTTGIVMVRTQGAQKEVQLPEWKDGWASARFREFGTFQLVEDKTPPVVTPLQPLDGADLSRAPRIAFLIKDNLGALRNFRAELDGAWLCFTNDKGLAYIYKFDEHCPAGEHTLNISVEDVAGNKTVKEYHFTR
ncbi:MAG TPA: M23 family metallopeptidase [Puia sp.]